MFFTNSSPLNMKPKHLLPLICVSLLSVGYAQESDPVTEVTADHSLTGETPIVLEVEKKAELPDSEVYIGMKEFNPRLTKNLAEKFEAAGAARISSMLKNKKIVRSLNVWKITTICQRETFARIAQSKEGLRFLSAFIRDGEWLEHFLNSGPVGNPDRAVVYMADIFKNHPDFPAKPVLRKLATATALEYARNGWDRKDCLERFAFYKESYESKMLNPVFETLDYWDMRFVVGSGNKGWGSVDSLTWFRDNVRLPVSGYCGAAYQVPYRLENYFGDSIHGSDYYRTFNGLYEAYPEMVREVGAVCGGLSSYGTYAAVANGVPALTMGEPGHCAYAVRVDGVWRACNSVTPLRRSSHWNFYGSEWSMLLLTQEIMSDSEALISSGKYERLGDLFAAVGNEAEARTSYVKGLKEQSRNIARWRDYIDWEVKTGSLDVKAWQSINDSLCKYFALETPEICAKLLSEKVYPQLMPKLTNVNRKIDELSKYHKLVRKMGALQWDFGKELTKQLTSLDSTDKKTLSEFFKMILNNHAKDSEVGGMALAWCQKQADSDPDLKKRFIEDVTKLLARPGSVQKDAIADLADSMILTAEKNDDIEGFQAVGLMMKDRFKKSTLPKYKSPAGELLSKGGLIRFEHFEEDATGLWQHWGILEKSGGSYTSDKDKSNIKATVSLPGIGLIQGVVVITEPMPKDAAKDVAERTILIEGSEDGTSWTKIGETHPIQAINIINGGKDPVRAKKIRVTRTGGGKGKWKLFAVHVYGRRVS